MHKLKKIRVKYFKNIRWCKLLFNYTVNRLQQVGLHIIITLFLK